MRTSHKLGLLAVAFALAAAVPADAAERARANAASGSPAQAVSGGIRARVVLLPKAVKSTPSPTYRSSIKARMVAIPSGRSPVSRVVSAPRTAIRARVVFHPNGSVASRPTNNLTRVTEPVAASISGPVEP